MTLVGINSTVNANGVKVHTLHGLEEFDNYYNNPDSGRICLGKKAVSVYVGDYDVLGAGIKPGSEIEIYYDKAITTAKGTFQPIKRIDIISK